MPHIIINDWAGKTEEKKRELARAVATAVMETSGTPDFAISVDIREYPKEEYSKEVDDVFVKPRMEELIIKPKTNKEDW